LPTHRSHVGNSSPDGINNQLSELKTLLRIPILFIDPAMAFQVDMEIKTGEKHDSTFPEVPGQKDKIQ
jgi:hypothetical protein